MLEALGWPTLEQRCQTCRLSMLYKIQSGLAHCPTLKAKLAPLPSHQLRTHDTQFTLLTTRTQYRGSSSLPQNHQGLELTTHGSGGGPHPWRFNVEGIKLNNYLQYHPHPFPRT